MPVLDWQIWLSNILGWLQFWFAPRFLRSILILLIAYIFVRWMERCWQSWLHSALVSGSDRKASQAVWRRVRLLSITSIVTRTLFGIAAAWLVAEQFTVPREVLLWVLSAAAIGFLWTARHLLVDLAAGYALVLDDTLMDGDQISAPFGEGTVERITWFAVYIRTSDGTQLVVPHQTIRNIVLKVRRVTKSPAM